MLKYSKEFIKIIDTLNTTIEYMVEDISFNLAVQINDRMKELNINKTELAKRLGVSKSYISQILNGNNNLTIESIVKIANAIELQPIVKLIKSMATSGILDIVTCEKVANDSTITNDYVDNEILSFTFQMNEENATDGNTIEKKSNYQTA